MSESRYQVSLRVLFSKIHESVEDDLNFRILCMKYEKLVTQRLAREKSCSIL